MTRRTLIYLVLLGVLGILTFVKERAPKGPEPIAFSIPSLAPEAITKVSLSWEGESVTLLRSEPGPTGTFLVEGLDYPADAATVKSLLGLFAAPISMDFQASEDPEDWAQYEVDEAKALKIEVFGTGDTPGIALYIGKNGPMGTQFVRPLGGDAVYRTKIGALGRYKKSPEDWRDRRVLFLESGDIRSIALDGPKGALSFERAGEEWRALVPGGLNIDQTLVGGMARSLGALRAVEVLEALPPGALEPPYLTVTLGVRGASPMVLTLGEEGEPGQRYAQRSSDGQGFLISNNALNALLKGADDLRDRALLRFEPEAIERIRFEEGERRIVLAPGDGEGSWTVLEPANAAVFPQTMAPVVSTLSRLRVASFPEEASLKGGEVGDTALEVEVALTSGERHRLRVGEEAEGGAFYAQVDDGDVVTIYSSAVKSLRQIMPLQP